MNAKDLMIGDWVYVLHGGKSSHYGRVTALLSTGAVETDIDGSIGISSYVDPIPITPEILEKNGFEKGSDNLFSYGRGMYVMMWSKGHYSVGQIFGNWSAFVEFAEIRFIHELQHALRLCGIEKKIVL